MEAKIKMKQIDAALLQKMLIGGAKRLEANKEYINELNVFPVPDGDTGTNMTMTALAAAKEVGNAAEVTVKEVTRGLSSGSLRGARGNSGVILSQLFRGFYKGVKDQDVLTTETVAAGFKKAVETAYKAVMKPKEGTILTVAKVTAEKAVYCARNTEDFEEFAQVVIKEANEILQKTPEMLPVLKEAGVVDSGGQGLVEFLQGAVDALMGKEVDLSSIEKTAVKPAATASEAPLEEKDIKFGYCTEFIVMTKEEISAAYKTVASEAYKKLGFDPNPSEATANKSEVAAMSIKSLPEIGQEETVAASHGLAFAVSLVAIADMVGDLYANPEFTVTDKVVTFSVAGATISLLPVLDVENNRVYIECISNVAGGTSYLVLDFSFNFSSKTLGFVFG